MPVSTSAANASASKSDFVDDVVTIDRRRNERRSGDADANDVGVMDQPRRKKQRRRHIDPTTCERDYNEQEVEFMRAMDDYKRDSGRMFPTCSEVLEVIRSLGYVQIGNEPVPSHTDCEPALEDYFGSDDDDGIDED